MRKEENFKEPEGRTVREVSSDWMALETKTLADTSE